MNLETLLRKLSTNPAGPIGLAGGGGMADFYAAYAQRFADRGRAAVVDIVAHFAATQRDLDLGPAATPVVQLVVTDDPGRFAPLLEWTLFTGIAVAAVGGDAGVLQPTGRHIVEATLAATLSRFPGGANLDLVVITGSFKRSAIVAMLREIAPAARAQTLLLLETGEHDGELIVADAMRRAIPVDDMGRIDTVDGRCLFVVGGYFSPPIAAATAKPAAKPSNIDFKPFGFIADREPVALEELLKRATVDGVMTELRPRRTHEASRPATLVADPMPKSANALSSPSFVIQPLTVSAFRGAKVSGSGMVLSGDGQFLEESLVVPVMPDEFSTWGRLHPLSTDPARGHAGFIDGRYTLKDDALPGRFRPRVMKPPVGRVEGPAVFAGALYHHVYLHWLIDVVDRLWLLDELEAAGITKPKIVISGPLSSKRREMLALAGVTEDRIVEVAADEWVEVDELILPNRPARMYDYIAPEVFSFFDRIADRAIAARPVDISSLPRRLNAGRGGRPGRRRLLNEPAINAILEARGCKLVEFADLSLAEEFALFRHAELVAAPHGSAFGGMMFMPPGSKVCTFFVGELLRVHRHHYTITAHRDMDLSCVIGESFGVKPDLGPWVLSTELVEAALAGLGV